MGADPAPRQPIAHDIEDCRRCPRLAGFLREIKARHPDYHCRPVMSWGASRPRLLVVGLAPGLHGANATGRPFTGDFAGILLYRTLHAHGFASRPVSVAMGDGLELHECRISNAVRCLPPENKPTGAEIRNCNPHLRRELGDLPQPAVVLALGTIAHGAVLRALARPPQQHPFAHGSVHALTAGMTLIDSYHCSRYNTQTRRLTEEMFDAVVARARQLVNAAANN